MAPLRVNVKRLIENQVYVVPSAPHFYAYGTQSEEELPEAGDVILMLEASTGVPDWTGKAGWTLYHSHTDAYATYRLWGMESDGTETGITFLTAGLFYLEFSIAAITPHPRIDSSPLTNAVHSFTNGTNVPPFGHTMTPPTITPDAGKTYTARMEFLTGEHAISDTPHPTILGPVFNPGTDTGSTWRRCGWLGNTALGASTVGWYVRGTPSLTGEEWFCVQGIQVSMSWLVDIPAGGWEINKVTVG